MHVFMNPTHKPTDFCGYVGQFSFDVIPASGIPPPIPNRTHMWLRIKRNTDISNLLILHVSQTEFQQNAYFIKKKICTVLCVLG